MFFFRKTNKRSDKHFTARKNRAPRRQRLPLYLEVLEDRTLPSTVNWMIAGGGNFDTAANWSGGKVPGSGDDAVINTAAAATITIQSGDNILVQSVTTAATDTLSITGGALSVTAGSSTLNGPLTMNGGSLTASGLGVAFLANGSTHVSGASLFTEGGASLSLPGVPSYTGLTGGTTTLEATGAGSTLTLANLTSLTEDTASYGSRNYIEALAGGTVNLPALTKIRTGYEVLKSDGTDNSGTGSVVNAPALTSFTTLSDSFGNSLLQATNGHAHDQRALGHFTPNVDLTLDGTGTLSTSQITSFTNATFTMTGSTLALGNGLTNVNGSTFLVSGGASLSLPGVTSYTGQTGGTTTLEAKGASSTLTLANLTGLTEDTGSYGSRNYIEALTGGTVDLPALTQIHTGYEVLESDGMGSVFNAPALTSFTTLSDNFGNSLLQDTNGGTVNEVLATFANVDLTLDGTGTLATSQITSFTNATFTVTGGTLALGNGLTKVNGSSFLVSGGAALSLPGVTSYTGQTGGTTTLEATGAGSTLTLANLTSLTEDTTSYGSRNYIEALAGGTVNLPALTTIRTGFEVLKSDGTDNGGTGSVVNAPALTSFTTLSDSFGNSLLQVTNGAAMNEALATFANVNLTIDGTGTLSTSQITSFTNATFTMTGGTLALPSGLTNVNGSTFLVSGGAALSLPGVTSYIGQTGSTTTLEAKGAGSTLTLANLTSLTEDTSSYGSRNYIEALAGGTVDLPALTQISTGYEVLESDGSDNTGTGSVLNVPALTSFTTLSDSFRQRIMLQVTNAHTTELSPRHFRECQPDP